MMRFTKDEFEKMVDELLYKEPISFDMLCRIAEKTLKPTVVNWCNNEDCLRGRSYEGDIMNEIHLRLMKTTVDYFLLRDDIEGPYNDNPEGFEDWLFRVADNIKRDFANKVRNIDFKNEDIDGSSVGDIPKIDYDDYTIEKLSKAFFIVMSSDVSVYKVLTWLAQFIFIINYDVTKIKSNELIIKAFEDKTLYEMYKMILSASKNIPWIVITEEQNKKILTALRKNRNGDVTYGETTYSDFFMKHNGEISGKKSISDWMNRMNDMIKCKFDEGDDSSDKSTEKTRSKKKSKKRRDGDETSDC